jgi:type II secretory pathway pseudopilin PulG
MKTLIEVLIFLILLSIFAGIAKLVFFVGRKKENNKIKKENNNE